MSRFDAVSLSDRDRRRLWGKSGNRCALCRGLLTHPEQGGAREAVVGEEAHIIGRRPGSARYEPLPAAARDAYENRILLCPTDHKVVDQQPERWTVDKLQARKAEHEKSMTERTADVRSDCLNFHVPKVVLLGYVIGGQQLLEIVGPADLYIFESDALESAAERTAAKALLDEAHDVGELYGILGPGERIDVAHHLGQLLAKAMQAGLLLRGTRIDIDVTEFGHRHRRPLAILRLRRAADIAAEEAAAKEAEEAMRAGGIEGLEAWSRAKRQAAGS
jgi:hypothetical protein